MDTYVTKGKWKVYEGGNFTKVVPENWPLERGYIGGAICELDDYREGKHWHNQKHPEIKANARLIAAAPDTLRNDYKCVEIAEKAISTTEDPVKLKRALAIISRRLKTQINNCTGLTWEQINDR